MKTVMRLLSASCVLALMLFLGVEAAQAVEGNGVGADGSDKAAFAPGELLVKFKGVQYPADVAEMDRTAQEAVLYSDLPSAGVEAINQIQGQVFRISGMTGIVQVKFSADISVEEAIGRLQASGAVEYAEPNYRVHVTSGKPSAPPVKGKGVPAVPKATPTDLRFAEQWALNNTGQTGGEADADIDAVEAWNIRRDASTTIVGLLGTGIYYKHDDLAANMWKNPGETCGDGIDNDANGYKDDCYGIDAYLNSGDPIDMNGLGTHMAGIVGAVGNNTKGVAGVAWKAKIMALKFLDEDGWGWVADAVQCIDYALAIKVKNSYPRMVILATVMGANYSKALYDAINRAKTNGVLFVTGAGDPSLNVDWWPLYPGAYDLANILNVDSSRMNDTPIGSSYGPRDVDLAAPGESILNTWLTNTYKLVTGSNAAAAHVAGAAALTWSQNSAMDWKKIKGLILNGTEDGLHGDSWLGRTMTEGRLNLNNSLTAGYNNDPAIFSITPEVTNIKETITITGINFGMTKGTIGLNNNAYTFPAGAIVTWADEKIVAKIPAACPTGARRLTVITTGGTSRGAYFRLGVDEWINPAWMGTTLMQHEEAAGAQVGNDVWIISGRSNYEQTASVERFSLLTMRGTVLPDWDIPKAVRRAGAAAIGQYIYVVGGHDDLTNKDQSALQIFDTKNGTWTRGRNLPQPLDMPSVVAVGANLYVMGGRIANNTALKTNYMYNPATNTWTEKAKMVLNRAYAPAVVPSANKIWLMSGWQESGGFWSNTQNVLEYNVTTNLWEQRDDIPLSGPHTAGGAITVGKKVFCLYGVGDSSAGEWIGSGSPTKWIRDIGSTTGENGSYTPIMGKINNYIYEIGGSMQRNVFRIISP